MEITSETTHRQEEFRGHKYHEQRSLHAEPCAVPCKLRSGHGDTYRRAAVGEEVHYDYGVQLHHEDFHSHESEIFGFLVHLVVFELVGFVYFQRCHALQILKECAAELCILPPVFCKQLFRYLLHHNDSSRYQRNTYQQHTADRPAPEYAEHHEQCYRRKERVEELRDILSEIAFELIHALDGFLHKLCGRDLFTVLAAEFQQFSVYQLTHSALDAF